MTLGREQADALDRARRIPVAWARAQALAHVAWHAPADAWEPVAREAAEASRRADQPFQRAAMLAWPIRVSRAVVASIPEGKYRRQAERRLDAGGHALPRWFFDPRGSSVD